MEDVSAKLLPALFSLSLPAKSTIATEIAGQMILKIAWDLELFLLALVSVWLLL